jgi:hypothetical protein
VHGHHLHPPADPEHGEPAGVGGVEQRELPGVPVRTPDHRFWVRLLVVPFRLYVGAAGDHQPVEPSDHGNRRLVVGK